MNNNNLFKFSLQQGDIVMCEKVFDADVYNPLTRTSIDIRNILPSAINRFQKILSKKHYDVILNEYNLLDYYKNLVDKYPDHIKNDVKYKPKSVKFTIDDKQIRGVECKLGLYINDNPIVERVFYVDGFNPVSRFSNDVLYTFLWVVDDIMNSIQKTDKKNIWDDYDLINYRGFNINQIREMPLGKRNAILRSVHR